MVDPRLIGVDNDLNERNLSRQGQRGKQWENNLFYFLRRVFLSASFQELGTALKIYDWSFFFLFSDYDVVTFQKEESNDFSPNLSPV